MAGINAFGTRIQIGPAPDFATIANVHNISGPTLSRETLDSTAHDSPNKTREFTGSLLDSGEVTLELHYDPAVHNTLRELLYDDDPTRFRMLWPPSVGGHDEFDAVMTAFETTAPFDGLLGASITLKVSGSVTDTPAA